MVIGTKPTSFDFAIENSKEFQRLLNKLGDRVSDFRIPFNLIANDFYRSNRKLFTLQSAGLYQDLAPAQGVDGNPTTVSNYKEQKKRKLGFVYPILVGETGRLAASVIDRNSQFAVNFIGRKELQLGSSIPYGVYHNSNRPRTKIPQRKFVFIDGGPADKSQDSSINGRRERWTNIINDHVTQILTGRVL